MPMMSDWRPSFPKKPKLSHICSLASKSRFVELGATCKFTPQNAIAPHISGLAFQESCTLGHPLGSGSLMFQVAKAVDFTTVFGSDYSCQGSDMHPISFSHVSTCLVVIRQVVGRVRVYPLVVCHSTAGFLVSLL
jgi:hypothetical protein